MEKIVLISGHAENGKDEFAKLLKKHLENNGKKVIVTRFAKYLKQILIDYYGWDGTTKNEYWRNKLQELGTEVIRLELKMPHFHVNRICEDISIIQNDFDYVLIPDARFPNEIHYTRANFPDIVEDFRVMRIDYKSTLDNSALNHHSETALDSFHFSNYIENHTIEQLDNIANNIVSKWVENNEQ